jgi:hypothetical protein
LKAALFESFGQLVIGGRPPASANPIDAFLESDLKISYFRIEMICDAGFRKREPDGEHFLLSKGAKTLSLAQVFRMSDVEAENTFKLIR